MAGLTAARRRRTAWRVLGQQRGGGRRDGVVGGKEEGMDMARLAAKRRSAV